MLFIILFNVALCWSPQMLSIAFEIGMKYQTSEYRSLMLNAFRISGDDFSRAAEGIQWLYIIEKPPYNIPSFDHWHFDYYAYNPEKLTNIIEHKNTDSLLYSITQTQNKLFNKESTRVWPFSFNLKLFLTFVCDAHSIFHANELFTKEFLNGDDHGRKFTIEQNGEKRSLFDFWESGCGEFESLDWRYVNESADQILNEYPSNFYENEINWLKVLSETREKTNKFGYSSLKSNQSLSIEYINQCKLITHQQIARAGYALQISLNKISIDNFAKTEKNIIERKSEILSWSFMVILLPFTIFTIYRRLRSSK